MAKLQFIEEIKADGSVIYYTEIDGKYVNDSLRLKKDEALTIYNNLKNGAKIGKVVLEEAIIND